MSLRSTGRGWRLIATAFAVAIIAGVMLPPSGQEPSSTRSAFAADQTPPTGSKSGDANMDEEKSDEEKPGKDKAPAKKGSKKPAQKLTAKKRPAPKKLGFLAATSEELAIMQGPPSDIAALTGDMSKRIQELQKQESQRQQGLLEETKGSRDQLRKQLFVDKGVVSVSMVLDENFMPVIQVKVTGLAKTKIPREIDGYPVRTVLTEQSKSFVLLNPPDFDQRAFWPRPVPIGVSAINSTGPCASGTLGCRVIDRATGRIAALSNNHVFAGENAAAPGSPITQPSFGDNNCDAPEANIIGGLLRFKAIDFASGAENKIDGALIDTTEAMVSKFTLPDGYGSPSVEIVDAFVGMAVQKYGRTTGYRQGIVTELGTTVNVGYDVGVATFVDQVTVRAVPGGPDFGLPGDSGSLVVDMFRNPTALLFAGGGGNVDCNPMKFVGDELNINVDGDSVNEEFLRAREKAGKNGRFTPPKPDPIVVTDP